MIRIFWICKNDLFTYGIEKMLNEHDIYLAGVSKTADEALEAFQQTRADLIVMDMNWNWWNTSGVELIERLFKYRQNLKIIPVTNSFDPDLIEKLKALGVSGYFFKNDHPDNIIHCIKQVFLGESSFGNNL